MLDPLALAQQSIRASQPVDLFASLMEQDERLAGAGFPPISPWWQDVLRGFYGAQKRRLVARVGRRGGKSSTMCRVAVNEVLHGAHAVPPGDVGVFAFVSTKKDEARERLATIREILTVLGVEHEASADEVVPHCGRAVCFRVYAADFRRSVGFTGIGLVADEVARWRDDKLGANPATEVLRSMRPTLATQPNAHEFMISSPWSTLDAHFDAMAEGATEHQATCEASTWVANPTINEGDCVALEPDDATRAREYGAVPMSALAASVFDFGAIDDAVARCDCPMPRSPRELERVTAGADFGFRRDSSGLVVCHQVGEYGEDGHRVRVADLLELRPGDDGPLKPSETVQSFAEMVRRHGTPPVMADGHYRESITEHLAAHDLAYVAAPTDVPGTYVKARTLLHQGRLTLPNHPQLIRDLKEVQSRPTASGRLAIVLPRHEAGGHADLVSALILAATQKGGYTVPEAHALPRGWTQRELDAVARIERRNREERGESSWLSDDEGWLSDG